jgi:hypothetical protein
LQPCATSTFYAKAQSRVSWGILLPKHLRKCGGGLIGYDNHVLRKDTSVVMNLRMNLQNFLLSQLRRMILGFYFTTAFSQLLESNLTICPND